MKKSTRSSKPKTVPAKAAEHGGWCLSTTYVDLSYCCAFECAEDHRWTSTGVNVAGVARYNLDGVSTQGLVGAAVGVRLERKWVSAGVTLGYPLWTRQLLREVPRKPIVYINATFSL
jgi:hemolysin activation/secretion protein